MCAGKVDCGRRAGAVDDYGPGDRLVHGKSDDVPRGAPGAEDVRAPRDAKLPVLIVELGGRTPVVDLCLVELCARVAGVDDDLVGRVVDPDRSGRLRAERRGRLKAG